MRSLKVKWEEDEIKIRSIVDQSVDPIFRSCFKDANNLQEIIQALRVDALQDKPGTFMALMTKFFHLQLDANKPLMAYINELAAVVDKIEALGPIPTWQEMINYKILTNIPEKARIIQQILCQVPRAELTHFKIKEALQSEDARNLNNKTPETPKQEKANQATTPPQGTTPTTPKKPKNCKTPGCKGKVTSRNPRVNFCLPCIEKYQKKKEEETKKQQSPQQQQQQTPSTQEPKKEKAKFVKILMATTHQQAFDTKLYFDSAASNHMIKHNQFLTNARADNSQIIGISGAAAQGSLKGDLILTEDQNEILLQNVLYSPEISIICYQSLKYLLAIRTAAQSLARKNAALWKAKLPLMEKPYSLAQ